MKMNVNARHFISDVWSRSLFNVKLIGGGGVQLEKLTASKANDFFPLEDPPN